MAKSNIGSNGRIIKDRRAVYNIITDSVEQKMRNKANALKPLNPDAKQRIEINTAIIQMLAGEKTKAEILTYLTATYPNCYLSIYFETWIEHHSSKQRNKVNNREEDGEKTR